MTLSCRREALLRKKSSNATTPHHSSQNSSQDEVRSNPECQKSIDSGINLSQRSMIMSTRGLCVQTDCSTVSTRGFSTENGSPKKKKKTLRMSTRGLKVEESSKSLAMNQADSFRIPDYIYFETPAPELEEQDRFTPVDKDESSSSKPSSKTSHSTTSLDTTERTLSSSSGSNPTSKKSKRKLWLQKFSTSFASSSAIFQSSKSNLKTSDSTKATKRFSLARVTGFASLTAC